jgi:branched-chain amino acid transport system permease protein
MLDKAIKDALITTAIAVALLGPLMGFILHGFEIEFALKRVGWLALVVFFGRLLFLLVPKNKTLFPQNIRITPPIYHPLFLLLLLAVGFALPFIISSYWLSIAILALIYVLLGLGLNIVVGLAGLLDLGYVAFYAVGAYGYALTAHYLHWGFWLALPFSAILAAFFGAILGFPVLRMHGDYLAIVTLGFGEIIRLILNNWGSFTGGPNGMEVPPLTFFGLEFTRVASQGGIPLHEFLHIPYNPNHRAIFIFWVLIIVVCCIYGMVTRLQRMPLGRAWEALREDEIACRSLGINHVTTKLSAFSMGALIGGMGGVFFAAFEGFVNPASFTFGESALILAIVVLGGLGSRLGVVIAAVGLTVLPELLREFSEYRMLLFGALLVLMMIWRPQGLIRNVRTWIAKPKVNIHG